jgi:hypothetical protein
MKYFQGLLKGTPLRRTKFERMGAGVTRSITMANPKWVINKGGRIDKQYEKWLKEHPVRNKCAVCGLQGVGHHVGNRRSDSYKLVYLCDGITGGHHRLREDSYHVMGQEAFEELHGIRLYETIAEQLSEYIFSGVT